MFVETEEECATVGAMCTSRCLGESCHSYRFGLEGACFVDVTSTSACDTYGVTHSAQTLYTDDVCVLSGVADSVTCAQVPMGGIEKGKEDIFVSFFF